MEERYKNPRIEEPHREPIDVSKYKPDFMREGKTKSIGEVLPKT